MAASLTKEEIAWMMTHENDTRVPNIYACSIITGVASLIVLLLRLWARRVAHGRVMLDISDWSLVIAWVSPT
ncbi:hypothetical protein F4820DRAFT_416369 [Hypoxylon rubiginosum]|uniref:Uncharacterized protein n=1 Tax=Hypoxylon rubiginosum TaxID=110542 RepID=A0ACB9Z5A5_9PEZI|nr:hypothetical protein F4820DRAFT_416369 [Hypoxylon rubiginosum]